MIHKDGEMEVTIDTWLVSSSFIKRSIAVVWHNILWWIIIYLMAGIFFMIVWGVVYLINLL
jgi:hypothetical protein